jgi:hypothetical protein
MDQLRMRINGLLDNVQLLTEKNERMQKALEEIRDVAGVSDGVEFYVMLAEQGLGEGDES